MRWVRQIVCAVLLAAIAGSMAPAAGLAQAMPSGLPKLSPPTVVDRVAPTTKGLWMNGVSCPSANLCVAIDQQQEVLTASRPTRAGQWLAVRLLVPQAGSDSSAQHFGLDGVTCPSVHLCVAFAGGHYLFVTKHPRGTAGGWHRIRVRGSGLGITAVSCANPQLCVAVDSRGVAFVSTDPLGGARAWHQHRVVPKGSDERLSAVSCPANHLCAALGTSGSVFTTTYPLRRATAWRRRNFYRRALDVMSCPSAHLCVVVDSSGRVFVSTRPATGIWHQRGTVNAPGSVVALSCRSISLCVAVTPTGETGGTSPGHAFVSRDPAAGTGPWHSTLLPGAGAFAVACGSERQCVAVTRYGDAFTTSDPANGAWQRYRADGVNPFTGVSCPELTFCVGTDKAGDVLASGDPRVGFPSWHGSRIDPAVELTGISCPGLKLCVAVDQAGTVLTSTDLYDGAGTWSRAEVDPGRALEAVDCPSRSLCVAVDDFGTAFTSTDPAGGVSAWSGAVIDQPNGADEPPPLGAVTCASPAFCLAVDRADHMLISTNPTGGASAWHRSGFAGSGSPPSASCPSSQLCVVAESRVWASTHPERGTPSFQIQSSFTGGARAVGCPSTSLCLFSKSEPGSGSKVYASTKPAGGKAAWSVIGADPDGEIVSFSCRPGTANCVAVDNRGAVINTHARRW